MLRVHQKVDTDCDTLEQWVNETGNRTPDELQTSRPYIDVLSEHLDRIAEVDEIFGIREYVDATKRLILHTSAIEEVIEEADQWPGTPHEGVKKLFERILY